MAAGAWDMELLNRAFWQGQFGVQVSANDLVARNPYRQPLGPPPVKSEETRKAESKAGWALVRQFFGQKKR